MWYETGAADSSQTKINIISCWIANDYEAIIFYKLVIQKFEEYRQQNSILNFGIQD